MPTLSGEPILILDMVPEFSFYTVEVYHCCISSELLLYKNTSTDCGNLRSSPMPRVIGENIADYEMEDPLNDINHCFKRPIYTIKVFHKKFGQSFL